jgi:dephospho-CoA kinase
MRLIGLSGTNGAGKDTVGEILAEKFGYLFISMTDMLREEALSRGLDTSREVLRTISAEWRRELGLGVLIDKSIAHYEKLGGDSKFSGLVLASLRNPGENDRVHELGGDVIWIDADPHVRYDRIFSRSRADDPTSFEQFMIDDQSEMKHSGDNATLSMADVKDKSDKVFMNEYDNLQDLFEQIKEQLL